MNQESPPPHLDIKAFAQAASVLSGQNLLTQYQRLMQETQGLGAENKLSWQACGELRGEVVGSEQAWLHLTVDTCLPLTCQRCLGLVDIVVAVKRSFRFVANEQVAQTQDDASDEDVLVLSPDFNLVALIEDEVLMALPLIARHETCPVEVKLAVADPGFETVATEKRHPFAVLAALHTDKSD
jgi:uncharacterized protein